jgi:two-component system response regulator AlgR
MRHRILIVDDEAPARDRLRALVEALPDAEVVGEAANGVEAIDQALGLGPDIVLLDVRMPGLDGLQVAQRLAAAPEPPAVIFTTAYDEYALPAFETQAVAYLLKPIRADKLAAAIDKAGRLTRPQLAQAAQAARFVERRTHIAVRRRDGTRLVPIEEVLYFFADQKYTTVRHLQGEELIDDSLRALEDELGRAVVRIHRNTLVLVDRLTAIERDPDGQYFVRLRGCPERLAVSRRMASELRERFRI